MPIFDSLYIVFSIINFTIELILCIAYYKLRFDIKTESTLKQNNFLYLYDISNIKCMGFSTLCNSQIFNSVLHFNSILTLTTWS